MNKRSKYLISLAKKVSDSYKSNPDFAASMVTGSSAKGISDMNSDVDMSIFYKKPISKKHFEEIKKSAIDSGGGFYHGDHKNGFAVYHIIDGVKVDTGHGTITNHEKMIKAFLKNPTLDYNHQIIASGTLFAIPLYGKQFINKWKKWYSNYPEKLEDLMIKENLRFHSKWVLEKMGLERNESVFVTETILKSLENSVKVLCGLNNEYHPGKLKGMNYTIKNLKHKPKNLKYCVNSIFKIPQEKAVKEVNKLVKETVKLVEKYRPDVDTKRVNWLYNWEG
ncbi:MAG: hypothetical protein JST55_12300 [Bacteroidetes bacterium]|nr:hypothetical protein [Bacteroidota bacterium]